MNTKIIYSTLMLQGVLDTMIVIYVTPKSSFILSLHYGSFNNLFQVIWFGYIFDRFVW
jgi:hypothetical protein